MARVSIIIPVYNAEKYLEKCITSIANQTMKDIEILVINDGSTDNSLNILDELSLRYNGKLKIYDKENGGAGSARNIGLKNANGEFIKFVDADDYLEVNILEKMYTIAKDNKVSLVRGNYQTILGPFRMEDKCSWGNIQESKVVDVTKEKNYIVTEMPGIGNKLISRDLIGNLRFPEQTKWEDLAIIPVVIASSEKLFHLNEPVYNYRVNRNTTVKDFLHKIPNILDIIKCVENIERLMKLRGLSEEYQDQIESLYILHTLFRVENVMHWISFQKEQKQVVISSLLGILDIKYPNWQENKIIKRYGEKNVLFQFDMNRLNTYSINEYRDVDKTRAVNHIKKVLK